MSEKNDTQYVFKFECAERWENLTETADENIRHCQRCGKNVHLVRNDDDFIANAEKGNCIYAIQTRTAGVIVPPEGVESQVWKDWEAEHLKKIYAKPISFRIIQLVLFFIAAFPLISLLPFYIQKTMTRSRTSGGDVIDYGWKARTLYGYVFDYNTFRPEENFFIFLAVNLILACIFAFVVALVIVYFIIIGDGRRIKIGPGR